MEKIAIKWPATYGTATNGTVTTASTSSFTGTNPLPEASANLTHFRRFSTDFNFENSVGKPILFLKRAITSIFWLDERLVRKNVLVEHSFISLTTFFFGPTPLPEASANLTHFRRSSTDFNSENSAGKPISFLKRTINNIFPLDGRLVRKKKH